MRTVQFNRQQYARDFKRIHHSYEQAQYKHFNAALKAQVKPVIDYIKTHGKSGANLSILVLEHPIKIAYQKCYVEVGVKHAGFILKWINQAAKGKKYGPGFFSSIWHRLMQQFFVTQSSDRITNVTETTRDRIKQVLADSEDMGISMQADYIVNKLEDPEFTRIRALMIARTESTTAANQGALLGADSSDYETGKIWIPVMDMNTRADHAAMDGSPAVGIDEDFEVGGELAQYPGDIRLSAKECINCRCAVAMVPLMDDRGLPILKVL